MPNIDREIYLNMVATLARGWSQAAGIDPKSFPPLPDDALEETDNLSTHSEKNTPEPTADVWISFREALEISALLQPQLTKMCNSGKITARGKRKGRQVCLSSLLKFMGKTSLGWARINSNIDVSDRSPRVRTP